MSASVRDGRLVIVVEADDTTTYYDLAAADDAIGAVLGCDVDVVTAAMLPREKEGEDMVTPRRPDETDAEYLARLADTERRWEQLLADAGRASAYMLMLAEHGRRGGYDVGGLEGWQRRSAFLQGGRVGFELANEVHGAAGTLAALHPKDFLEAIPPALDAALTVLDRFNAVPQDVQHWISQAEIDAVVGAAEVVAEQLRPAIEKLRKLSQGS